LYHTAFLLSLTAHARHRHCNNAVTNIRQIQINILVLVSILKSALQSCCIVGSRASGLRRMFKLVGEAVLRYTHSSNFWIVCTLLNLPRKMNIQLTLNLPSKMNIQLILEIFWYLVRETAPSSTHGGLQFAPKLPMNVSCHTKHCVISHEWRIHVANLGLHSTNKGLQFALESKWLRFKLVKSHLWMSRVNPFAPFTQSPVCET